MANLPRGFADMSSRSRAGLLFALGLAAALGQAPYDLPVILLISVALLIQLHHHAATPRQAAWQAWFFGIGYFGLTLRWIVEPFLVDIARHGWMAPFALLIMAASGALFWALAGYLAGRIAHGHGLMFALTLVWAEIMRAYVLTGFPWVLLGHGLIATPFVQLAGFGGPHLLTVLLVGTAWFIVGLWNLSYKRLAWTGLCLVACCVLIVGLQLKPEYGGRSQSDGPLIRLVQPNAPQHQKWDPAFRDVFLQRMLNHSAKGPIPDLIVWPETAIPSLLNYVAADTSALAAAARGAPMVFGIQRRDDLGRYYNSFVVMDGQGAIGDVYDKSHLVPFGEYVPGSTLVSGLGFAGLADQFGGGFTAGSGAKTVHLPGIGSAIPLICYEGIFAEEISRDGARSRLMVMITNDAWFGTSAGPHQHLAQARLRAIEQGLPMVRVANTGVSAMIDAQGRVIGQVPLGVDGAIDVRLPPTFPPTVYTNWGDVPVLVLLILLTLGAYVVRNRIRIDGKAPTT